MVGERREGGHLTAALIVQPRIDDELNQGETRKRLRGHVKSVGGLDARDPGTPELRNPESPRLER